MTLYLLRERWWSILCPPSVAFVIPIWYCIIRVVHSLLTALNHPQYYTLLTMVHFMQVPRGSPDTVTKAEVLTQYSST